MNQNQSFHSGFVAIVGKPNVGKSSLMNKMIGEKVAIVSNRPQTTRNRIMGIVTHENDQIVFLDTPGIHEPKNKLGEYMMHSVRNALDGIDCVLMVIDITHVTDKDLEIATSLQEKKTPRVLCINKIDLVKPDAILQCISSFESFGFEALIPVSAKTGNGLEELTRQLQILLPAGPQYFPADMMTDQPERILCAEIIREKALRNLRDEVPHGIGVEIVKIETFPNGLLEINATVCCERDAHKRIIIGNQGSMLKTIGSEARKDIENLLGNHVNLKLWVKVKKDWRNSLNELKALGYDSKA